MKTRLSFWPLFLTASLCFASASHASETALIDLITENLNSPTINAYLEPFSSPPESDANRRKLKQIEAFGVRFAGQATFKETSVQAVSIWCDETRLAPDVASRLFSEMSAALNRRIGEGKLISDVPNFEDASYHKKQVMLWPVGDQIVELSMDAYAARAGLSLQRINRSLWLEQMGADQGEFWERTLKATGMTTSVGSSNEQPSTQSPSPKITSSPMPPVSTPESPEAAVEVEPQAGYEMTATSVVDFDPVAEAKAREVRPYRLRGGAGLGQIVDSQGKVVLESGPESGIHIFGCEVSPNGKLVLIQGGDGKNLILDPSSGGRWLLPHRPPNENMFAFGSWHWIDDDTLLAASNEKLSVRDAQSRANAEEPGASRSRLYLFRISRQQLTTIQLAKDFGDQVFSIAQVSSSGSVHLVRAEPNASSTADLGWFKVRPK